MTVKCSKNAFSFGHSILLKVLKNSITISTKISSTAVFKSAVIIKSAYKNGSEESCDTKVWSNLLLQE